MIGIPEFRKNFWVWPTFYGLIALLVAITTTELFQLKLKRVPLSGQPRGKVDHNFFAERPKLIDRH